MRELEAELVDTTSTLRVLSRRGGRVALPAGLGETMSETVDASKEQTDPGFFGPEPQVIELRVHGVSGTPPEAMLEDPFPRQVAGDDVGRFFRRGEPIRVEGFPDRDVEAYHWGRFTSGSPTRALWLLLLPFAVVTLPRFALLLPTRETEAGRPPTSAAG